MYVVSAAIPPAVPDGQYRPQKAKKYSRPALYNSRTAVFLYGLIGAAVSIIQAAHGVIDKLPD